MFREIRRKNKEIGLESIKTLLQKERRGVLSVSGDNGYPYGVPINYLYVESENKLYFHGSYAGHKADSIKNVIKFVLLFMVMKLSKMNSGHHTYKVLLFLEDVKL